MLSYYYHIIIILLSYYYHIIIILLSYYYHIIIILLCYIILMILSANGKLGWGRLRFYHVLSTLIHRVNWSAKASHGHLKGQQSRVSEEGRHLKKYIICKKTNVDRNDRMFKMGGTRTSVLWIVSKDPNTNPNTQEVLRSFASIIVGICCQ
jgi:hypothetical protein